MTGRRSPALRLGAGLCASVLAAGLLLPAEGRVIGRSAEISIGRESASIVEQFLTVDTDPAAVARVRRIGRRLAAAAEDQNFPYEFHVVEEPEVNAFALPGGFIYVYKGLLRLLPSDDALAFVMAHEISHVTGRHAIRQFEKNLLLSGAITAILAGTGVRGVGQAGEFVAAVAGARFTRKDESDADEVGIALLVRAGYDPSAAAESMRVVKRTGGDGGVPGLLRTHPTPDSRIRRLEEWAADLRRLRDARRAGVPLPPPPPLRVRRLPGLDGVTLSPCAWQPLGPDYRWRYEVSSPGGRSRLEVRVLDELDADPEGVWRVEYDLGNGVRTRRLLAGAGERLLSRGEAEDSTWRAEGVFQAGAGFALGGREARCEGMETVRVPAGEMLALRVRIADPPSVEWYARNVGLIRRDSGDRSTRLLSYQLPGHPSGSGGPASHSTP